MYARSFCCWNASVTHFPNKILALAQKMKAAAPDFILVEVARYASYFSEAEERVLDHYAWSKKDSGGYRARKRRRKAVYKPT
mmetsp:Transcript_31190/g.45715  ORF Transcript_31190/g.45715 Transcript_31190/m.45715 type:complete len:82 (+) Transcript_31190:670-915(+)